MGRHDPARHCETRRHRDHRCGLIVYDFLERRSDFLNFTRPRVQSGALREVQDIANGLEAAGRNSLASPAGKQSAAHWLGCNEVHAASDSPHFNQTTPVKLRLDFLRAPVLCGGMDDTEHQWDLIQQLLLEAGRVMEDGSPVLARHLPHDRRAISSRIDQLARDGPCIVALASAAAALLAQSRDQQKRG